MHESKSPFSCYPYIFFVILISSTTLFAIELSLVPIYRQHLVQECCWCTVFFEFCQTVCYVSVIRTVFFEFCLIVCYVCVSRTVIFEFCLIVCYVCVSRTVSLSSVKLFDFFLR